MHTIALQIFWLNFFQCSLLNFFLLSVRGGGPPHLTLSIQSSIQLKLLLFKLHVQIIHSIQPSKLLRGKWSKLKAVLGSIYSGVEAISV